MDERNIFQLADRALCDLVSRIREDQWTMTLSEKFARHGDSRLPSLREVINAHAYDDAWVPDMLAGRSMEEVGRDAYSGDLLGDDPATQFAQLVDAACLAAAAIEDLDRIVHCSFGDYSARDYFCQVTMFRGLRTYDLATELDIEVELSPELVQGMWDEISPTAEQWRAIGVFPSAIAVPETAPLLDRLLGLTGREPSSLA